MSNTSLEKAIDRVRKLLAQSRSDNPHEAAIAAEHAARLMEKYELTEAIVRAVEDSEGEARAAEPIVETATLGLKNHTAKRCAWRELICDGVAELYGCRSYLTTQRLPDSLKRALQPAVFGRLSATQAWSYTSLWLHGEVERLADQAWAALPGGSTADSARRWKNSFRYGCAQEISARLVAQARQKSVATDVANSVAEAQAAVEGASAEVVTQALAIIDRDREEVASAFKDYTKSFGTSRSLTGGARARGGFEAGVEAGRRVNLRGGGRGALPTGQGSLP